MSEQSNDRIFTVNDFVRDNAERRQERRQCRESQPRHASCLHP